MTARDDVLAYLAEHPDSTCREIAEALGADARGVGSILTRGVQWGRIVPIPQRDGQRSLPSRYRLAPHLCDRLAPRLNCEADDDAIVEEVEYLIDYHDRHSGRVA